MVKVTETYACPLRHGLHFNKEGKAVASLWAPLAKTAVLVLSDSSQQLPLEQERYGWWTTVTNKIKEGDYYKFLIDGENLWPDPASLSQPEGVHGPSQAIDVSKYTWQDAEWKNFPLAEYLLYELHTGTFTEEGSFAAIESKLDYLKDLGVNAIEIMPVAQFPGGRNWGYDGVYPFAVQASYGGPEELQHLVEVCHSKGIAVVLDAVYNHFGPEGAYINNFAPYCTAKYCTPWGNAVNFDDAWCDGVRQFYVENALMWFRDFHVDALRLDAVHAIKDFSPVHILQEIRLRVDELMQQTGRTHYLITELDLNDPRFIKTTEQGGYGMDAQWADEFHHALRVSAGEDRRGYFSDFNGIEHLAKAYQDAYVYDGQFSPHRKKKFGLKTSNEGHQFIVFSQNHDQVGNRMLGERTSKLVSFEMQKLLAGAVMVSPFLPLLFMGEEWSEPNPFLYFVSHTDPELAELVRQGRKEEFAYFQSEGVVPDPVAVETFNSSKLQWHLLAEEPHKTMFCFYKQLIQIRKTCPALHQLIRGNIEVKSNPDTHTLWLHRWYENDHIICAMNFSSSGQTIPVGRDIAQWYKLLNSADVKWGGKDGAPEYTKEELIVQPESILIYANKQIDNLV